MSRERVAIVTPGAFPVPSGKSSSVELVAVEAGKRLSGDGMEVILVGKKTKKQPITEVRGGIRYVRPPAKPYIRSAGRYLKKLRPAVIQVENRPRYAALLKRCNAKTPVVLSLHSVKYISEPYISARELRACFRRTDAIVVNSHFLKEQIVRLDAAAEPKITVNHLGVDTSRFVSRWTPEEQHKRLERLEGLGLSGKKIILYVGRFIPIKGVHHLLAAMPAVIRHEPEAVLILVGGAYYGSNRSTPYVARLHRMAVGLKPHIRFVPFVSHNEVPDWFRLADVVVVPSVGKEAFGLVNVEAMATGVPVIASAAGGMKEIIVHGRSGWLVDPGKIDEQLPEAISSVLGDPLYGKLLGENGMCRVLESFTWQHTANRLLELYRRLRPDRFAGTTFWHHFR